MAGVDEVEVVVAHHERATLRVGPVFLKIDADQARTDVEVEAMAMAPVPTPEVLWRKPPVLALAAFPGTALGRLGAGLQMELLDFGIRAQPQLVQAHCLEGPRAEQNQGPRRDPLGGGPGRTRAAGCGLPLREARSGRLPRRRPGRPGSAAVVEGHLVAVGVRERESAAERPVDGR